DADRLGGQSERGAAAHHEVDERADALLAASDEDPGRWGAAPGADRDAVDRDRAEPRVLREPSDHGYEIEAAVRDVECEQSVRLQRLEVERERLTGQQVQGDRIAAEGIDDQEVEARERAPVALGG